jgi:DNA-directed RNA polymerase specialized sigma24 family protein
VNALPARTVRRRGDPDVLDRVPAPESENPEVEVAERTAVDRVQQAVCRVLGRLPPADRIVLRMRFEDGIAVVDIARLLHLDAKRVYRRLEELIRDLRREVLEAGLRWQDVKDMVDGGRCRMRIGMDVSPENARPRPSHQGAER